MDPARPFYKFARQARILRWCSRPALIAHFVSCCCHSIWIGRCYHASSILDMWRVLHVAQHWKPAAKVPNTCLTLFLLCLPGLLGAGLRICQACSRSSLASSLPAFWSSTSQTRTVLPCAACCMCLFCDALLFVSTKMLWGS